MIPLRKSAGSDYQALGTRNASVNPFSLKFALEIQKNQKEEMVNQLTSVQNIALKNVVCILMMVVDGILTRVSVIQASKSVARVCQRNESVESIQIL